MLERYFVRSATIDRIRASWIAGAIERYVEWLTGHRYAPRNVLRRVSLLERFGDFDTGKLTCAPLFAAALADTLG
jgi:integrase/recombinase XerD